MLDTFPGTPAELVVHDEPEACPYLPGQVARLPLRVPARRLAAEEADARWAHGDRRHGLLLYRPACPECRACEPMRIPVASFTAGRRHRRILRNGDRALTLVVDEPRFSQARLALYEKHKELRGLRLSTEARMGAAGYRGFFTDSCVDTLEMSYWYRGRLAGVAIVDRGARALSAVYTYYDPELARLSPGTYSILKQLELCRRWQLEYLYLGFFVRDNPHMRYKAEFRPHERLIDGAWVAFA